ncbi:hypothetical protein K7X08_029930 [Anisodus acutangulus]|uniref:Uncharacterized protein n=1 Tax=Anisodus acutangulus TaxID=402998 RepID=A0A9Q1LMZ6_9SOLA|nr:hypothetical protein K7X08_029930 [Anisodus acutangulus]
MTRCLIRIHVISIDSQLYPSSVGPSNPVSALTLTCSVHVGCDFLQYQPGLPSTDTEDSITPDDSSRAGGDWIVGSTIHFERWDRKRKGGAIMKPRKTGAAV